MKNIINTLAITAITLAGTTALHAQEPKTMDKTSEQKVMPAKSKGTIVEIASGMEDFSTLVAALKAADLVETLSGDGPFTVFAPTNEAFAALPEGTVEELLKPENKAKLQKILKFHVVPAKVMAADVKTMAADTAAGEKAAVVVLEDGTVTYAGQKVVKTDVTGSNGVIHVIDGVAMPEM